MVGKVESLTAEQDGYDGPIEGFKGEGDGQSKR